MVQSKLLRNYNILLLGQTGVGKSTFVNSISNYMTYDSLADAIIANHPRIVVDTSFNLMYERGGANRTLTINMQGLNHRGAEGGLHTVGASATTMPSVYSFACQDIEFNIIDVPGIGDTRGIAQDNLNKQAIIKEISRFPEIHGICIMVREDTTRLTNELLFCLNEVLSCLHRNAQDNILFVIPRSGPSDFMPQSIQPILNAFIVQLNEMRGTTIDLTDRIFCIDNEPFRFQCGYNQSTEFREVFGSQARQERYVDYWTRSKRNVFKFLSKMYMMSGHDTRETRAVAQANTSIQVILTVISNVMGCIAEAKTPANRDKQIKQLMGQGTFDKPDVEVSADEPCLVCIHRECLNVTRAADGQLKNAKFKQICHKNCRIEGVKISQHPEPRLGECQMFNLQLICRECNHHVNEHMHLPCELLQRMSRAGGEGKKMSRREAEHVIDAFLKNLVREQDQILQNMVTLIIYCRDNAIVAYHSAFQNRLETEKRNQNSVEAVQELNRILAQYNELVTAFQQLEGNRRSVSIQDVNTALTNLFTLTIYGNTIRNLFDKQLPEAEALDYRDFVRLNVSYIPEQN